MITTISGLARNRVYQEGDNAPFLYLGPLGDHHHRIVYPLNGRPSDLPTRDFKELVFERGVIDVTTDEQAAHPLSTLLRFLATPNGDIRLSVDLPGHLVFKYLTGTPFEAIEQERIEDRIVTAALRATYTEETKP